MSKEKRDRSVRFSTRAVSALDASSCTPVVFVHPIHLPKLSRAYWLTSRIQRLRAYWREALHLFFQPALSILHGDFDPLSVIGFYACVAVFAELIGMTFMDGEHIQRTEPKLAAKIGDSKLGISSFLRSWMSDERNMSLFESVGRVHLNQETSGRASPTQVLNIRDKATRGCCLMMNSWIWNPTLVLLEDEARYLKRAAVSKPNFDAFIRLDIARDMVVRLQEQIISDGKTAVEHIDALEWALAQMQDHNKGTAGIQHADHKTRETNTQRDDKNSTASANETLAAQLHDSSTAAPPQDSKSSGHAVTGMQLSDDVRDEFPPQSAGEPGSRVQADEYFGKQSRDGPGRAAEVTLWMEQFETIPIQLKEMETKLEKTFKLLISAITVLDSAEAKK